MRHTIVFTVFVVTIRLVRIIVRLPSSGIRPRVKYRRPARSYVVERAARAYIEYSHNGARRTKLVLKIERD